MNKQELLQRRSELKNDIAKYNNLQLAKKVQLNSAYGALGNNFFRFFDLRQAEAITMTGRLSILWIGNKVNAYVNRIMNTEGEKYVIYSDTDSIYVCFDRLVKRTFAGKDIGTQHSDSVSKDRVIEFIDRVCEEKIKPYIDKCYQELAEKMNAYEQKMSMKREVIADRGIWTAKKRYILNVYDKEGVRYTEPKLKIMGIEAIKSSTPQVCRESIKEALKLFMSGTESDVQEHIEKFRKEFHKLSFEAIAFPRGITDIDKYTLPDNTESIISGDNESMLELVSATPIHCRAALVYNRAIRQANLTDSYEEIKNGEKLKFCYMKMPNPLKQNVFAVIDALPKELQLEQYIDHETQFIKSYLEPLTTILDAIGWQAEHEANLEEFFN
jgi:DNA polymerase elongation subunit (family B)